MRYRLMATYRGVPYEAGIGPTDGDVVLFAACPPPEELGFEPATGHWRKQLRIQDVQALWESRPMGRFRGDRCIVLDDLGERLHIAYLGHDAYQAEQLGYWQVDRGVFELVTPREEVTEIIEDRVDYPRRAAPRGPLPGPPRAAFTPAPVVVVPPAADPPLPLEAAALRAASARAAPQAAAPPGPDAGQASPRRRRSAQRREATRGIFSELASLAAIPPSAYAVGEEVDGAMCLIQTVDGFEVFNAAGGARHEVRVFEDEESAYFYLFGVLAAEAVRTGRLAPP
jgi:hypothetical protein